MMNKRIMNKRIMNLIICCITIAVGLFVRYKKAWFPEVVNLYLGDILYAFMMFNIVSFIVVHKNKFIRAYIALFICFSIELLQLYKAEWIVTVRQTLPGKLILGSGFLWSDLIAYLIGVAAAFIFEKFVLSRTKITKGNVT